MKLPSQVDVLVVGYGPVGAALACLLGRYGISALVVDKATEIYAAPRAIALDNEALRILQLAGLPEESFQKVVIPFVRMICPLVGQFGHADTTGNIDGHPKLVTFHQPELERALRTHLKSFASVQTALGISFEHFEEDSDGIRARLSDAAGQQTWVRAHYLVGADGASSRVRELLGLDFRGETYPEDWLVVDARYVPPDLQHVEFVCDPRRPTPRMVAPGGRTRWEFMRLPGETREELERDETVRKLLAPWVGDAPIEIERKAVYRFHARCCDKFQKGRAFLIGDAAHITPPFVGQGLVAGLRDAANLAWKLAWVVTERASPEILESYDIERRPHAKRMIDLARHMGKLVMPTNVAAAFMIHGSMRLMRMLPPARRLFDEQGAKPKPAFKRGLFRKGRGKLLRGGLFAQIEAHNESSALRSDELLGPGFALVGLDAEPVLDPAIKARWTAFGGSVLTLFRDAQHSGAWCSETLPRAWPRAWCVVVRPDRTILHDGPCADATRILQESIALLGEPSGARSAHPSEAQYAERQAG